MLPFHPNLDITPREAVSLFSIPNHVWIDVRERQEWEYGHLKEAHHLPLSHLTLSHFDSFDKQKKKQLIIVCRSGSRSKRVVETLQKMGYSNVVNLKGGLLALNEELNEKVPVLMY